MFDLSVFFYLLELESHKEKWLIYAFIFHLDNNKVDLRYDSRLNENGANVDFSL